MTANIEFSAICSLRKPEYLRTPRALRTTTLPPPPPPLHPPHFATAGLAISFPRLFFPQAYRI